jgi:sugar O-acyltransferase (sialic acid O-acetyltransferase NeuD family)
VGIFILGAGGMAREALNIYIDAKRDHEVLGFLEENCKNEGAELNGRPIRDISCLKAMSKENLPTLIGAIGSTKRKNLILNLEKRGFSFDTLIHPSVIKSNWVQIGKGSIVAAGSILTCQVKVGNHSILNLGVYICHDAKIGNFVTLSPGSKVMGSVEIGDEVFVGANATIAERVKIGSGTIIAAGAVVVDDVPELALMAGVPAEIKKIYVSKEEKPW